MIVWVVTFADEGLADDARPREMVEEMLTAGIPFAQLNDAVDYVFFDYKERVNMEDFGTAPRLIWQASEDFEDAVDVHCEGFWRWRITPRPLEPERKDGPDCEHEIVMYLHCGLCLEEWKAGKAKGMSPSDYQRNEVGWTKRGIQVWCKRHDCNVLHMDFENIKHPGNTARKLKPAEIKRKKEMH